MNLRRWNYYISLGLAFSGTLISLLGIRFVYQYQVQDHESRLWPLPGLMLVDWAALGLLGFLGAWFSNRENGAAWIKAIWFTAGALLPLVILGALSIGLFVLYALLFFLAAAVLLTIHSKGRAREQISVFLLGAIFGFVIVLGFIFTDGLAASFHVGQG